MTATTLVAPISLSTDLLTGAEWSPAHTRELLHLSADIKARPVRYASTLHGKFIALIFEKPSLRTRVTFDVGIQSMRSEERRVGKEGRAGESRRQEEKKEAVGQRADGEETR